MARTDPQVNFRIPADLKEKLEATAAANNRTVTAQIIHSLQSHLNRLNDEVEDLAEALHKAERANISIGLTDPVDRAAVLKVLLLEELMLLRRRIGQLGGPESVINASKGDIVKRIEGPKIQGTKDEQRSHLSQALTTYPLTCLLTDEELGKLAERVVLIQSTLSLPLKKTTN